MIFSVLEMFEPSKELVVEATPSHLLNNFTLYYHEAKFTTHAVYCSRSQVCFHAISLLTAIDEAHGCHSELRLLGRAHDVGHEDGEALDRNHSSEGVRCRRRCSPASQAVHAHKSDIAGSRCRFHGEHNCTPALFARTNVSRLDTGYSQQQDTNHAPTGQGNAVGIPLVSHSKRCRKQLVRRRT